MFKSIRENITKNKKYYISGLIVIIIIAIIVILLWYFNTNKTETSSNKQQMMNNVQQGDDPYKYIPFMDENGNMVTGTFQTLLNKMRDLNEDIVFPSNVTFSEGATIGGDVTFNGDSTFNKNIKVKGEVTGELRTDKLATNWVAGRGPNLKLKANAITLLNGRQRMDQNVDPQNIMIQTVTDGTPNANERDRDRVIITKRTGIGRVNEWHTRDALQVQGKHFQQAARQKMNVNDAGILLNDGNNGHTGNEAFFAVNHDNQAKVFWP